MSIYIPSPACTCGYDRYVYANRQVRRYLLFKARTLPGANRQVGLHRRDCPAVVIGNRPPKGIGS